jgi:hypothetical protein
LANFDQLKFEQLGFAVRPKAKINYFERTLPKPERKKKENG